MVLCLKCRVSRNGKESSYVLSFFSVTSCHCYWFVIVLYVLSIFLLLFILYETPFYFFVCRRFQFRFPLLLRNVLRAFVPSFSVLLALLTFSLVFISVLPSVACNLFPSPVHSNRYPPHPTVLRKKALNTANYLADYCSTYTKCNTCVM